MKLLLVIMLLAYLMSSSACRAMGEGRDSQNYETFNTLISGLLDAMGCADCATASGEGQNPGDCCLRHALVSRLPVRQNDRLVPNSLRIKFADLAFPVEQKFSDS